MLRFTWLGIFLCGISLLACSTVRSDESSPQAKPSVTELMPVLQMGAATLQLELACTPEEQQRGLMFRETLPENQGMLFVFAQEQTLGFWMKNTALPLSIAYISAQGEIVDIQDLHPFDEIPRRSIKPAQYALEVNQGWFARHQIVVGQHISLDNFCENPGG